MNANNLRALALEFRALSRAAEKQLRRQIAARKAKILRAARRPGIRLDPGPKPNGGNGNGRK